MNVYAKEIDFVQYIVIDLFCGAGGTTTGFHKAKLTQEEMVELLIAWGLSEEEARAKSFILAMVVACINHNPIAIKSHWSNYKQIRHFEEDITLLYGIIKSGVLFRSPEFQRLIRLIELYRAFYPNAKVILWASLECTNFSKAKGGMERDADSRTLAEHLLPYITALDPDFIQIENVTEFLKWGPMIPKVVTIDGFKSCPLVTVYEGTGKKKTILRFKPWLIPDPQREGEDFNRWCKEINALGYVNQWRQLNAADFGALTSRNRLFGCFAKEGNMIAWPEATHTKQPDKFPLLGLEKWQPVKKVLDFDDEGKTIFNRKKPLSTKTMQRLYMGCIRHIAGGKKHFISKYYSGNPIDKNSSIDSPSPAITTIPHESMVTASFLNEPEETKRAAFIQKYNSNKAKGGGNDGHSINEPCPVVSTQGRLALAQAHFIQKYYSNGGQFNSIEEPAATISTRDRLSKVSATFIDQQFSQGKQNQSVEQPLGAITTVPKHKLIQADFFLDKQYSGSDNHQSINQPAGSIMQNDKHSLVKAEKWLMNTNFNNVGSSLEDPAPVITADRHHHYLVNPSWGGNSGNIQEPCPVVIARQDKAPLYLITCNEMPGIMAIPIYDNDCEWTIKLKEFMVLYSICDIKMRMLKIKELTLIQGFPEDYVLLGTQADQKKSIGNSVVPKVVKKMTVALSRQSIRYKKAA